MTTEFKSLDDILNQFKLGKTDGFVLNKDIIHDFAEAHFDDSRIETSEIIDMFRKYNNPKTSVLDEDVKAFAIMPCYTIVSMGLKSFHPTIANNAFQLSFNLTYEPSVEVEIFYK